MMPAGTFSKTALAAETTAPGPISTPGAMKACAAIQAPARMVIGLVMRSKAGLRWSCEPVQRKARWERQTEFSNVTGARLRMRTSPPSQTWSPAVKRHGKVMLTRARMTTPVPMRAPKRRRSRQRNREGQGKEVSKKIQRVRNQRASLRREAPRSKPAAEKAERSRGGKGWSGMRSGRAIDVPVRDGNAGGTSNVERPTSNVQ